MKELTAHQMQSNGGKNAWKGKSKEEISKIMKKRAIKGWKKRKLCKSQLNISPTTVSEEQIINSLHRLKVVQRKREIEDIVENPFDYERKTPHYKLPKERPKGILMYLKELQP